jgi:peroxiredoxin
MAFVSVITAFILVINADLPERTQYLNGESPVGLDIGSLAPTFVGILFDGNTVNLSQLYGSAIVINFWATWCEPCQFELPILQRLYSQHRERGLHVLAVNLGESESVIQDWATEMQISFDIVLDEHQHLSELYQLRGVPSTYILNSDGVISAVFYGPTTESQLQTAIAPSLALGYTPPGDLNP